MNEPLTDQDVANIRALDLERIKRYNHAKLLNRDVIAAKYDKPLSTIEKICQYKSRAHIRPTEG